MGVSTDQPAVPFQSPPTIPGIAPSGINAQPNIRGMATNAKKQVSDRMAQFRTRMQNNAPVPGGQQPQAPQMPTQQVPAQQPNTSMYVSAAAALNENHDIVERFVDWVLFKR